MVLYTTNKKYEDFAVKRLANQRIKFIVQQVDDERINLFFGCDECIEAICLLVNRPLNKLTPEEDFILGAMLGYDICVQCRRYCAEEDFILGAMLGYDICVQCRRYCDRKQRKMVS